MWLYGGLLPCDRVHYRLTLISRAKDRHPLPDRMSARSFAAILATLSQMREKATVHIRIGFEIAVECAQPVPMLLSLRTRPDIARNTIGTNIIRSQPSLDIAEYIDIFGNRIARVEAPVGKTLFWSDCIVEDSGEPDPYDWHAKQHEIMDLPAETLEYLLASRYCESDELVDDAWELFGDTEPGWARAQAIANWVHNHVLFDYRFGRPTKTAHDVFREATGVCRDFSHLFIALCRAMNIPARYASGFLGDIGVPPSGTRDFSAWSEVFLGNRWWTFDARYNTPRIGRIVMVRGRDAADVAVMTAFGNYELTQFKVWTDLVDATLSADEMAASLDTRPDAEALVLAQSSGRLGLWQPAAE